MKSIEAHPTRTEDHLREPSNRDCIDRVSRRLAKLEVQNFWGEVVIKVRKGKITLLTWSEDLKPEDI